MGVVHTCEDRFGVVLYDSNFKKIKKGMYFRILSLIFIWWIWHCHNYWKPLFFSRVFKDPYQPVSRGIETDVIRCKNVFLTQYMMNISCLINLKGRWVTDWKNLTNERVTNGGRPRCKLLAVSTSEFWPPQRRNHVSLIEFPVVDSRKTTTSSSKKVLWRQCI